MQSLRDKLLKAGVVTEEQAKSADAREAEAARLKREEAAKRSSNRSNAARPQSKAAPSSPRSSSEAPIPKLPPLALPGSKAFQRLESLKQVEQDKRLREMVKAADVPLENGTHSFHFMTRKGKLRRLEMTEVQAKLLEEGKLAVVERPEPGQIEHSLVPKETAELMLTLSEKSVRFFNRDGKPIGFLTDEELAGPPDTGPETPGE